MAQHCIKINSRTKGLIGVLFLFLLSGTYNEVKTQEPLEVLFIGNSLTYYNELPKVFEELSLSAGKHVFTDYNAPGGRSLFEHAHDSVTLGKISERKWDFIVLQGSGPRIAYPNVFDKNSYEEGLRILELAITKNFPSTRILVFMPWAYEDGMQWYQGWLQDFVTMQHEIYDKTLEIAYKNSLPIAPVGWVWYKLLKAKSYPEHYLHLSDWVHPTVKGTYLTACVLYNCIFLEENFGNTYTASLSKIDAQEFQIVADSLVIADSTKWNLSTYVDNPPLVITNANTIRENFSAPITLYQNYPNPVTDVSYLKFELKTSMKVLIQLFDIKGNNCRTVLDKVCEQGVHIYPINARNLGDGIYFLKLSAADYYTSIKIHIKKATSY